MTSVLRLTSTLLAVSVAAALLAGCKGKEPTAADFIASAEAAAPASQSRDICVPLTLQGDVTSINGGVGLGWVAFGTEVPSDPAGYRTRSRSDQLDRANLLVEAGVLAKDSYDIYQGGQLKPATRFMLNEKNRSSVNIAPYGEPCVVAGHWAPKGLVPNKDAKGVNAPIARVEAGDQVSYAATVEYEVVDTPDWLKGAVARAAFGGQLTVLSSNPRLQKVELSDANGKWVAKVLPATGGLRERERMEGRGEATPIPVEAQESFLQRMNDMANSSRSVLVKWSPRVTETPRTYVAAHPGSFFIAAVADPAAFSKVSDAEVEERKRSLAARTAGLTPEMQAQMAQMASIQARMEAAKPAGANAAETDKYLTQRKEMVELLDVLTEAGAMTKRTVKAAEVQGIDTEGTLYVVSPELRVTESGIQGPVVQLSGPLTQTPVMGGLMTVKAKYTWANMPASLTKLGDKLPAVKARLAGGVATARAYASPNEGTPRVVSVELN